jgi:hypothetical protein
MTGAAKSVAAHLVILGALTAGMVAATWRCWPDPIVDFGRELYTAWQIAEGAVLYRDVDGFYGPLSQYVNGALFRIFGPGLMVLVWANLAVFAGIVLALYLFLRRGWRPATALAATAVFILVFGFSRFSTIGSFNFAAPYAHEVTHGMLLVLLLAHVLWGWRHEPRPWHPGLAGLLAGLTLLLKPEFVLTALAATGFAGWERFWSSGGRLRRAEVLAWLAGMTAPTVLAVVYFGQHVDFGAAFGAAGRGWLNVVATRDYVSDPAQWRYLGFEDPLTHLGQHGGATALALLVIAAVAMGSWMAGGLAAAPARWGVRLVVVGASVAAAYFWRVSGWMEVGRCLLGLAIGYLGWQGAGLLRRGAAPDADRRWVRLLLGVVAISLLARMLLNGRIYQFGFYQASLTGALLVAALLEDVPARLGRRPFAAATAALGLAAGLAVGVGLLVDQNRRTHALITEPMGQGRDQFRVLREDVLWTNPLLAGVTDQMMSLPPGQTLVCLPEGLMINYLARMRSPLPHFFYYSVVTEGGRERRVVDRLQQSPPDWVLVVPRGLEEYGITRYGERPGAGAEILAWVRTHYDSVGQARGEPMTVEKHRLEVFRRR